VDLAGYKQHSQ